LRLSSARVCLCHLIAKLSRRRNEQTQFKEREPARELTLKPDGNVALAGRSRHDFK
jgi:hypothetical protein